MNNIAAWKVWKGLVYGPRKDVRIPVLGGTFPTYHLGPVQSSSELDINAKFGVPECGNPINHDAVSEKKYVLSSLHFEEQAQSVVPTMVSSCNTSPTICRVSLFGSICRLGVIRCHESYCGWCSFCNLWRICQNIATLQILKRAMCEWWESEWWAITGWFVWITCIIR